MNTQSASFDASGSLPVITPTTVGAVRKLMKEDGLEPRSNEEVSEYVEKLVAREAFFRVVDKIQERNLGVDPQHVEAAVSEAIAEVETQRRKPDSSADSR